MANAQPARTLDGALDAIADRYGTGTSYLVTMQLVYRGARAPSRP